MDPTSIPVSSDWGAALSRSNGEMLFPCYRKRHWFFGVVDSNLKKVWLEDSYLAATGARAHMEFMKVC